MEALQAVFWGVLTFSILVVMHEGGHFLAARAFGVKVHEFMLGLPGPAVRFKLGDTSYGATAVPLGGYVRIAGMEPGAEDPLLADALAVVTRADIADSADVAQALGITQEHASNLLYSLAEWYAIEPVEAVDERHVSEEAAQRDLFRSLQDPAAASDPEKLLDAARTQTYRGLPTWKRIVVLSAGVAVNLLAAVLVFTVVLTAYGYYEQSMTISKVVPNSAASAAGVEAGDVIIAIGDNPVSEWAPFMQQMATYAPGDATTLTYERDGAQTTVDVTLKASPEGDRALLGVQPTSTLIKPTIFQAIGQSFVWLGLVFVAIGQFFNPQTFQTAVSGARSVVGISVEVRDAARAGALSYAWIVALLSLSLGAMNILPIPPLDGGKVAMEIIEKVVGRPVSRRISIGISIAGTLLLFSLIGYLMYADVMRYIVNG